ncbi:hypothetical protein LQZ19_02425 [Treponema primitia]|uniref:hypothetical protein n=1 Tax=Treponema primitia TaxID=88058 RepID=UPI00398089AE
MKTKTWSMGINLYIITIMSAMESNEIEYMYSDLSIERAEWEIVTEGMGGM